MADTTALKFSKNPEYWENEDTELEAIYSNPEQRAQIYDVLGSVSGADRVFDKDKWQQLHNEFAGLSEAEGEQWLEEHFADNQALINMVTDEQAPEHQFNQYQTFEKIEHTPEQVEKFKFLNALETKLEGKSTVGSTSKIEVRDGKQVLRINNLNDTGLNFAIYDDLSIVFTKDQQMSYKQVDAFAKCFDDMGLNVTSFEAARDVKVVGQDKKVIGSFEEVFKSYNRAALEQMELDELIKLQQENEDKGIPNSILDDVIKTKNEQAELASAQENAAEGQEEAAGPGSAGAEAEASSTNPFAEYLSYPEAKYSINKIKEGIFARAGIMRINKRCITTRRLPDGSLAICFYGSEGDIAKDCTVDKNTGEVKHTKKCAFVMCPGTPPRIGLYLPQGAKMEGGYAKAIVGGLKKQGYIYIKLPGAAEIGGDVFESMLKACGDQLAVPEGADLGADHLRVLLKAAEDRDSGDKVNDAEMLEWKMRLIERLNRQQKNKPNDQIQKQIDRLEGDVRVHYFRENVLPALNKHITNGVKDHGWNNVDVACAYKAIEVITTQMEKDSLSYIEDNGQTVSKKYNVLGPDQSLIDKVFAQQMGLARNEVLQKAKEMSKDQGTSIDDEGYKENNFNRAMKDVQKFYSERLTQAGGALKNLESRYAGSAACEKISGQLVNPSSVSPVEKDNNRRPVFKEPDISFICQNAEAQYKKGQAKSRAVPVGARSSQGR